MDFSFFLARIVSDLLGHLKRVGYAIGNVIGNAGLIKDVIKNVTCDAIENATANITGNVAKHMIGNVNEYVIRNTNGVAIRNAIEL